MSIPLPTLTLDCVNASAGALNGYNFTRASTGTFVNRSGRVVTATANTPRFDHDLVTGQPLGLLLENRATNLLLHSNVTTETGWTIGANTTRVGATTAPDGSQNASIYRSNATSNSFVNQPVAFLENTTYTVSVYARLIAGAPTLGNLFLIARDSDGVAGTLENVMSEPVSTLVSGWRRYSFTFTNTAAVTGSIHLFVDATVGTEVALWGAQLEVMPFATSLIPTTTAAATRIQDVLSLEGAAFSAVHGSDVTGFSMFLESQIIGLLPDALSVVHLAELVGAAGETTRIRAGNIIAGTDVVSQVGGANVVDSASLTVVPGQVNRFGLSQQSNVGVHFAVNGTGLALHAHPTHPIPTFNRLVFSGGQHHLRHFWLFQQDLTPAQLVTATQPPTQLPDPRRQVFASGLDAPQLLNVDWLNPGFVPLVVDAAWQVPVWLDNGDLAARGLAPNLLNQIQTALDSRFVQISSVPAPILPVATDAKSLFAWKARIANLQQNSTGILKLLITGDSWTEYLAIPQQLANVLRSKFGQSGYGWISLGSTSMLDGASITRSGWSVYDASTGALPTSGCGIDGKALQATGVTATLTVGNCRMDSLHIFYNQGSGAFRYRVSGGAWQTVVGTGTGQLGVVTVAGLPDVNHTVDIDLVGNTGTVTLYGMYATRSAPGVELIKAGNSGLDASQATNIASQIGQFAGVLAPDVVVVCLGTNDYRRGIPLATYTAGLQAIANAYRRALPRVGFIFIAPGDSNGVALRPLVEYRDAMHAFCAANGFEFYNHHAEFSTFSHMNALGMWADNLHLNAAGGRFVSNALLRHFLDA